MRASSHSTIVATPGQDVLGRYMILNIALVFDCWLITTKKQRQVDIDKVHENDRRVSHDYAVDYLLYADMTDIFH